MNKENIKRKLAVTFPHIGGMILFLSKARFVLHQWFCYYYFQRHLSWKDNAYPATPLKKNIPSNIIWMYWRQGEENAPLIVKKCIASIRERFTDHQVVVLNGETYSQYITMPDHIERLFKEGHIGEAQYSDLLRISLLYTYGGIWCDATCFATSAIPDIIKSSPLFFFQKTLLPEHLSPIVGSSWFIASYKNNVLLGKLRNLLFEYWRYNNKMKNYYQFHIAMGLLAHEDAECRQIVDNMPYFCNANPHVMLFSLYKKYTPELYHHTIYSCFIQKLTYKYDQRLTASKEENILQHFLLSY